MENDDRLLKKELKYYDKAVFDYLKCNHNRHIPVIFDYYEEDGVLIVTEERIDGVTLDKYLEDKTPNRKEKVKLIEDLCDGLIFLHNAPVPIIHRDIKANNIMIDKEGVLKIIDYDAERHIRQGSRGIRSLSVQREQRPLSSTVSRSRIRERMCMSWAC